MATNLDVLKPSRAAPQRGDVFVLRLRRGPYLFGRVISAEAKAGPSMPGAILVYVFDTRSDTAEIPDRAALSASRLLIAPVMINKLPWSRGYFQTIGHLEIAAGEELPQHCFRSGSGRYYDENCVELVAPTEPCGQWGLASYRVVDDKVSDALGVARAAD